MNTNMDKMFFFPCEHCYTKLVASDRDAGKSRACSHCKKEVLVPNPPDRVPPMVTITNVSSASEVSQKITIVCPYCQYLQKIPCFYRGKKIYCQRCKFTLEIPSHRLARLDFVFSNPKVKADGKSIISIKAILQDEKGILVSEQPVHFDIYREHGESFHIESVTDQDGVALTGYTSDVYTGNTKIKAYVPNHPGLAFEKIVEEADGILDGNLQVSEIAFEPQEEGDLLVANVTIVNPGTQKVEASSISIQEIALSSDVSFLHPCRQNFSAIPFAAKEKHRTRCEIRKRKQEPISHIFLLVVLEGKNLENSRAICQKKQYSFKIPVREPLTFTMETSHHGQEIAGVPFYLEFFAMRGSERDTNWNEELACRLKTDALASPQGDAPAFPSSLKLIFREGICRTEESFCFYNAQTGVSIEASLGEKKAVEEKISVIPSDPSLLKMDISSPQKNRIPLTGTNCICILDRYGNQTSFSCPVILNISEGTLTKPKGEVVRGVDCVQGYVNLSEENWTISLERKDLPCTVTLTALAHGMEGIARCLVNPKPAEIAISEVKPVSNFVEQGQKAEKILVKIVNSGDCDFKIDSWSVDILNLENQSVTKYDAVCDKNLSEVPARSEKEFPILLDIRNDAKEGKSRLTPTISGKELYYGLRSTISSTSFGIWHIEPCGRVFQVETEHDGNETAGVPFSLTIKACRNGTLDLRYTGMKRLYFGDKSCIEEHPNQIPEFLDVDFHYGVGRTTASFVFFKPHSVSLSVQDKCPGGAHGILKNVRLLAGALSDLEIYMTSPQTNHIPWQGENYVVPKDLYGNVKTDFSGTIALSIQTNPDISAGERINGKSEISEFQIEKGENGVYSFPAISLDLPYRDLPQKITVELNAEGVSTKTEATIHPQAGEIVVESLDCALQKVEVGEKNQNITIHLTNTGETALKLLSASLNFLKDMKSLPYLCGLNHAMPVIIQPHQRVPLLFVVDIPLDSPIGQVSVSVSVVFQDGFYGVERSITGKPLKAWDIEPNDRLCDIFCDKEIISGSPFFVQLQVTRFGKPDIGYNHSHVIHFSMGFQESRTGLSGVPLPETPDSLELSFQEGKACTPLCFRVFSTLEKATIAAFSLEKGGFKGEMKKEVLPGPTASFQINSAGEQIVNSPFTGTLSITVLDRWGNVKTDFQETVEIRNTGKGKLLRSEQTPFLYAEEFHDGVLTLDAGQFRYVGESTSLEDIDLILCYSELEARHALKITPEPARLKIVDIKPANEVVEWEKQGYPVILNIKNEGGSDMQLTDVDLSFSHQGKRVEQGYSTVSGKESGVMVEGGKTTEVSVNVGLARNIPIGMHTLSSLVKARDLYYNRTVEDRLDSSRGWQVEPTGRKIIARPIGEAVAYQKFALEIAVTLDGQIDTHYTGHHIMFCVFPDVCPKGVAEPALPPFFDLNFEQGKARTQPDLLFFHSGKEISLDFYETGIGSASGKAFIHVRREIFSHFARRKTKEALELAYRNRKRIVTTVTSILLLILFYWHWQTVDATKKVKVIDVKGKVTAQGIVLKAGDILYAKQAIQVEDKGLCVLQMMNGTVVKLYGSSNLYTDYLGRGILSDVYCNSLRVHAGDVVYQTQESEKSQIQIPDAENLGIDSKHFRLGVQKDKSTVSVYQGKISVSSAGKTVDVNEGKGSAVTKGAPPSEPSNLPGVPIWLNPKEKETITTQAVPFRWSELPNTAHYVLEISESSRFPFPLWTDTVVVPEIKVATLEKGMFKCQVSCVDRKGFASMPSNPLEFHHNFEFPAREVVVKVISEIDRLEIVPDKITIAGSEFRNGSEIRLGRNLICVSKKGYDDSLVTMELKEGEEPYHIDIAMVPKDRPLEWKLYSENFAQFSFSFKEIWQDGQKISTMPEKIKPGQHKFVILVRGFHQYESSITVPPGEETFLIPVAFVPSPREVKFSVSIPRPNSARIVLRNEMTNKEIVFQQGMNVEPGTYRMITVAPGYLEQDERIVILPEDTVFEHTATLSPKKRKLSGTVADLSKSVEDEIVEVLCDGKTQPLPFLFDPGKRYDLVVWLRKNEPLSLQLNIEPDEADYKIKADLEPYPSFVVKVSQPSLTLDGLDYSLSLSADRHSVPPDMLRTYNLGKSNYCEFRISKNTTLLRMAIGFYYGERKLEEIQKIRPDEVDWQRLREHLDRISISQRISRLRKLCEEDMDKLKRLSSKERDAISSYIASIQPDSEREKNVLLEIVFKWNKACEKN